MPTYVLICLALVAVVAAGVIFFVVRALTRRTN